jgi:transposase-like protein
LDILVQRRRDKKAAKKFLLKLLKGLRYAPSMLITDKLKSYGAAKAEVMPSVEHCQQKDENNRAENSHQPTRLREKVMRRFKSMGHAQRFLSVSELSRHASAWGDTCTQRAVIARNGLEIRPLGRGDWLRLAP